MDQNNRPAVDSPNDNSAAPRRSRKKKVTQIILYILMAVCVVVLGVSGYKIYETWNEERTIQKETDAFNQYVTGNNATGDENGQMSEEAPSFTVDWEGLKAANPNINAWILVPGTGISYPVVQAMDNNYYLNHSFNGAYNRLGAVFLDCTQNPDYQNQNSIIYAHTADVGGMFTNLKDFNDLEFFNAHPYFWLLTPSQNYRCTINAFYAGSDDSPIYTTDFGDYRKDILDEIQNVSLYYRPLEYRNHNFVTLSTCNMDFGLHSDQRFALMGMMEKWSAPIPAPEEN